jgi:hypothetical protein
MPWRNDFVESFWLDPDWVGLSGYPEREEGEKTAKPRKAARKRAERLSSADEVETHAPSRVERDYFVRVTKGETERPIGAAVIVIRDRIGFQYERQVGLDDFVSTREAAQLLELPVMTITRWVRAMKMKSSKRNGFVVIRLREVLRIAKERQTTLKLGSRLIVVS